MGKAISQRRFYTLQCPVFLVGFMGAGKTTTARRLARECGIASLDMDTYIERNQGQPIREIFSREGEEGFRNLETQVLKDFASGNPLLISCGGGVVKRAENRRILQDSFVVYLKVSVEEAASRISDISTRPLFQDERHAEEVIRERLPLYEEVVTCSIDTAQKSPHAVVHELKHCLIEKGVLCPRP